MQKRVGFLVAAGAAARANNIFGGAVQLQYLTEVLVLKAHCPVQPLICFLDLLWTFIAGEPMAGINLHKITCSLKICHHLGKTLRRPPPSSLINSRLFAHYERFSVGSKGAMLLDQSIDPKFVIVGEEIKFARYLTFYNQTVRFPATTETPQGEEHEFDIIGHPRANFHFCVTFPFHPAASGRWQDGHVTLVREYCQGINELVYCLPTGAFDPRKHKTYEDCATAELSEEAHLKGGKLLKLLEQGVAVPEVKWCRNKFTPFIVIAPEVDSAPGQRDKEEFIQIVRVSIPELKKIMRSGEMLLPSVTTCWWALEHLMDLEEDL